MNTFQTFRARKFLAPKLLSQLNYKPWKFEGKIVTINYKKNYVQTMAAYAIGIGSKSKIVDA